VLLFLRGPILGCLLLLLLVINTLFWGVPLYICIIIKFIIPAVKWRQMMTPPVEWVARSWMHVNLWVLKHSNNVQWKVHVPDDVDMQHSYMIIANHQSWVDILALYEALIRKTPFARFFLKKELLRIPILGQAWWGLDFPAMQRHSKEDIAKNPELAREDIETTRRSCEYFKGVNVGILIFPEGTRISPSKHARQQSTYKHLLKPKSGGMGFAISTMGEQIDSLLDVTIVYPEGVHEMWDFLCGRMQTIEVSAIKREIPDDIRHGDYLGDPVYKAHFQEWLNGIWAEKDQQLEQLHSQ